MLIPLHVKSHYSLGVGTASPERLVEVARDADLPALGLTDLENLYGQMRFHRLCAEAGVRPVTGVELRPGFEGRDEPGRREGRLVLLASDEAGYRNLCRIVSRRRVRSGTTSPRATGEDPVESVRGRADGLFVLSDHAPTVRRVVEEGVAAADSTRMLLTRPGPSEEIERTAERLGLPLVADVDAVTAAAGDRPLHLLLTAIARGTDVGSVRRQELGEPGPRALGDPADATARFADRPAAVREARRLAEACTLDLTRRQRRPMPVRTSEGRDAGEELAARCRGALEDGRRDGRFRGERYAARLERELDVIRGLGFARYFLAVADLVAAARERGIPTAGRGSAAASLVCRVLGATPVDPVERGLYFERFLHGRRPDPPDVDLDVDARRRDELIEWVRRRYGREHVARVSSHQYFRRRSAVREGLKALGMSAGAVDRVLRRAGPGVPGEPGRPDLSDPADEDLSDPADELAALLPSRLREALPLVRRLEGKPSHVAVHPAGLVVAREELASVVPLERAPKGVVVTQYDQRSVEAAGLLKIDLLGSRALAEIDETIELLRGADRTPDDLGDRLAAGGASAIPVDDPRTLSALDRAATLGCFQVESPAVRSVLRSVPVRGMEDLVAALAVVRPGAAAGRAKRAYVRRARGLEPDDPVHPAFGDRLDATHGLPLYEEDVLHLLHALGGVSLAEADELRAGIVAAGDDGEALSALRERFLDAARAAGREPGPARSAWRTAERLAAYSFSRAHAASHALLAYRTVFLRTHWPVEFGCAVLNNHGGMYPRRSVAAEVARWGVELRGPSVDRSGLPAGVERGDGGPAIRLGLGALRRVRKGTARALLRERPFRGLGDLLDRVRPSRAETRALVLSGACDGLPPLSRDGYPFVHEAVVEGLEGESPPRALDAALERSETLRGAEGAGEAGRRWRKLVRIRNELEHLEMHPSGHPMAVLRQDAREEGCVPVAELEGSPPGEPVRVAAVLAASRRLRTSGGDPMQFITLEDETGTQEAVLFPDAYRRLGQRVTTAGPYLVQGRMTSGEGRPELLVSEIRPFHERHAGGPSYPSDASPEAARNSSSSISRGTDRGGSG